MKFIQFDTNTNSSGKVIINADKIETLFIHNGSLYIFLTGSESPVKLDPLHEDQPYTHDDLVETITRL